MSELFDSIFGEESKSLHTLSRKFNEILYQYAEEHGHTHGYELMQLLDSFVEDNKFAWSHSIDDQSFASSTTYYVAHRRDGNWMGVTVTVVTQLDSYDAKQFFLYPCHLFAMTETLAEIVKEMHWTTDNYS